MGRRSVILGRLAVEQFAIIDALEAELHPGLNVITGETGAGKSLFVDAVEIALGGRASAEYVRAGSDSAVVQALFFADDEEWDELECRLGVRADDEGEILIERELRPGGRNIARINGRLVSVASIRSFAESVVDLHGQHEQQGLTTSSQQRDMLDALAGEELQRERAEVARLVGELQEVREKLKRYLGDEKERARELDLLYYQQREIDEADLEVGEEEELRRRQNVLGNVEFLREGVGETVSGLMDGGPGTPPLVDLLGERASTLRKMAEVDEDLASSASRMEAAQYDVQELARELRQYSERLDYDPAELRRVEERLDLISRLKAKYGSSVQEIIAYRDDVASKIRDIENSAEKVEELGNREQEILETLGSAAERLSAMRSDAAQEVRRRVERELEDLLMQDTQFDVVLDRVPDESGVAIDGENYRCSEDGVDRVQFMISPTPGEPLRPLHRIASGGEMARVMLALKNILADADRTPVLIFDEIDAGIGGKAGRAVARKLASLARSHQILCVTHLPQIACMADAHLLLRKETKDGRTVSHLSRLGGEDRLQELGRMLGGGAAGRAEREHASRLLEVADHWKEDLAEESHPGTGPR